MKRTHVRNQRLCWCAWYALGTGSHAHCLLSILGGASTIRAHRPPRICRQRFGTFYRTYLTLSPNYKHAGECMHFKNTRSAKLHVWMRACVHPRGKNRTSIPVYSDACIPDGVQRCADRLGATRGLAERKVILIEY